VSREAEPFRIAERAAEWRSLGEFEWGGPTPTRLQAVFFFNDQQGLS
jgi:hypothetical protein